MPHPDARGARGGDGLFARRQTDRRNGIAVDAVRKMASISGKVKDHHAPTEIADNQALMIACETYRGHKMVVRHDLLDGFEAINGEYLNDSFSPFSAPCGQCLAIV
jgi:hypothetical protein